MNGARHILIAEDDASIRLGLVDTLESEGYTVYVATNGKEALQLFEDENPDLAILDIMMPQLSGYDVCREIRKQNAAIPILMLSAKAEEIDKVLGLELGADDYVTKPFGMRELLARVSAALRRVEASSSGQKELPAHFSFGSMEVDTERRQAFCDGKEVPMTQLEYRLLLAFYKNAERALSRDFLLNAAWGVDYLGTTRTLDQHVSQLRRKIEENSSQPKFLVTVHGFGYRYCPNGSE
ncbi:response regulator transcription factor [Rubellicoccus peritrichatus]|uniref:Response regulator transcription factor n=1 Tax=Rubellicoccus peritrichatus TaxID=3080537 RepID=A0AAQ3QW75_9BACT|nr:response regulator transcription factor [Puniceicoccus sp. CR14]WOO42378.1 response regulator transcription factor [Puniceicoccus sp. CR14]